MPHPFGERVDQEPLAIGTFLGYAMAHELGHLLLPGRPHSAAGVMRASFPLNSRSIQTFTAADATAICARLEQEAKRS